MRRFSFFRKPIRNIYPYKDITLLQLYEVIKNPKYYAHATGSLRALTDKQQARQYKSTHFDYATLSGTFSKRNAKSLIAHSGYICIDFDHVPNIEELKHNLLHDDKIETDMLFVSPSGDGMKWIVSVNVDECPPEMAYHKIGQYISQRYKLPPGIFDESCKNVDRACFISFDEQVFINPKYLNNENK